MSCSENGNEFARGAASAILPSSLERVCEVRKGRKMNFDIRKGEKQRRHLRKLKKRDPLCLSRETLDVSYNYCDAQLLLYFFLF